MAFKLIISGVRNVLPTVWLCQYVRVRLCLSMIDNVSRKHSVILNGFYVLFFEKKFQNVFLSIQFVSIKWKIAGKKR